MLGMMPEFHPEDVAVGWPERVRVQVWIDPMSVGGLQLQGFVLPLRVQLLLELEAETYSLDQGDQSTVVGTVDPETDHPVRKTVLRGRVSGDCLRSRLPELVDQRSDGHVGAGLSERPKRVIPPGVEGLHLQTILQSQRFRDPIIGTQTVQEFVQDIPRQELGGVLQDVLARDLPVQGCMDPGTEIPTRGLRALEEGGTRPGALDLFLAFTPLRSVRDHQTPPALIHHECHLCGKR